MMEIRKTRTCEKCNTQVPLGKVKFYPRDETRNLLLCETCAEKMKVSKSKQITALAAPAITQTKKIVRNIVQPKAQSKNIMASAGPSYDTKYCNRCHYQFQIDLDSKNRVKKMVCPYCGKDDRLGFAVGKR